YQGFRDSLVGQKMKANEKLGRLNEMFADSFQPLTLRFIELIVNNCRYQYLSDICRNCLDMIRSKEQISIGKIVFAQPVGQELVDELKDKFQKKTKRNIELSSETDSSLIGGFIFTIDGMQYDASIATRLATIKKQLQKK
ncbi:MAG TPA: ATP synthase F1 subunit delta, partial [Prolixibacteraceae bacterium]|nr:ATP synthase F1 subunit delta [Prolixibacteraceae bacterium]